MAIDRFDNEKEQSMRKAALIDKSKKGSVDPLVLPIIDLFNSHPDYYTTSSCSGRVMVLALAPSRRKDEAEWTYVTHSDAVPAKVINAVRSVEKGEVWLKQESAIFHVACRDIARAGDLLEVVREIGFKRAGIIGAKRRVIVEIIGTDAVAIPLGIAPVIKLDEDYIEYAVSCCNERMRSNEKKLDRIVAALRSMFSNRAGKVTKTDEDI
ncbi:MAG: tRNA wybutosine-synthesizing 3 family protein [Nanoarchaeota archaeon]